MRSTPIKTIFSLGLLQLFLLLQIVTICPELHHRLDHAAGVAEQRLASGQHGPDLEMTSTTVAVVPVEVSVRETEATVFTFHPSWDYGLSSGRGPPLFHS